MKKPDKKKTAYVSEDLRLHWRSQQAVFLSSSVSVPLSLSLHRCCAFALEMWAFSDFPPCFKKKKKFGGSDSLVGMGSWCACRLRQLSFHYVRGDTLARGAPGLFIRAPVRWHCQRKREGPLLHLGVMTTHTHTYILGDFWCGCGGCKYMLLTFQTFFCFLNDRKSKLKNPQGINQSFQTPSYRAGCRGTGQFWLFKLMTVTYIKYYIFYYENSELWTVFICFFASMFFFLLWCETASLSAQWGRGRYLRVWLSCVNLWPREKCAGVTVLCEP